MIFLTYYCVNWGVPYSNSWNSRKKIFRVDGRFLRQSCFFWVHDLRLKPTPNLWLPVNNIKEKKAIEKKSIFGTRVNSPTPFRKTNTIRKLLIVIHGVNKDIPAPYRVAYILPTIPSPICIPPPSIFLPPRTTLCVFVGVVERSRAGAREKCRTSTTKPYRSGVQVP